MHIPDGLRRNVEHHPAGAAWLAALPDLRDRLAARWGLTVAPPFTTGVAAWTAPARTTGGADVVLKISLPHDEARGEAAALRRWDGRGAVRLLAHAPDEWALLLERCRPGTALAADPAPDEDRLRTGARVLRALHVPADGAAAADLRAMGPTCARGADVLLRTARAARDRPDRPIAVDRGEVDAAAALLRELPGSAGRTTVVHGDLNPGNVLRADDGAGPDRARSGDARATAATWVAIDPKPLVGDPAHDPWPLLVQVGDPFAAADPVRALGRRTALVAAEAGVDAGRVVAWSFARSVQSAYWYVAEGRWAPAADELARARVWSRLLDQPAGPVGRRSLRTPSPAARTGHAGGR